MYIPSNDKLEEFPPGNFSTKTPIEYTGSTDAIFVLTAPTETKTSDGKPAGVDLS
jgi:hypothetical protein